MIAMVVPTSAKLRYCLGSSGLAISCEIMFSKNQMIIQNFLVEVKKLSNFKCV